MHCAIARVAFTVEIDKHKDDFKTELWKSLGKAPTFPQSSERIHLLEKVRKAP